MNENFNGIFGEDQVAQNSSKNNKIGTIPRKRRKLKSKYEND